ncbi:MAG: hypothetical protein Q8L20_15350 [Gammaproteobacteria bacterium]|nr:hypothetical protein [Gammaproteobacteria bacterium]
MNVCFEYLYRDAGNFKLWGEVVFANKEGLDIDEIESKIRNSLIDGEYFYASKIGVPVLRFEKLVPAMDHDWHEFVGVAESTNDVTDQANRDVCELLRTFEKMYSPTKSAA